MTETPLDAESLDYVPPSHMTHYRWVVCALRFVATTINYVDRQILSLLQPILDKEMGWTVTQFGAINSAFQASYGLSVIFFGWYVDRFGAKLGYALSIGAWSFAVLGHALVNSIAGFFGARIAMGLGEGGNFPSAIKATMQWFPKHERAFATSLFNSGANFGAVLAPAAVPASARKLSMALSALCVVPIAAATHVGNWPAVLLIGLAGAAHQAQAATFYTTVSDMFPKRAVAKVIGLGHRGRLARRDHFPYRDGHCVRSLQGQRLHDPFHHVRRAYVTACTIHHLLAPKFQQEASGGNLDIV